MSEPPKRNRRWLQFSLRTLLIAVTLLAVSSAAVTWDVQDRQRLIRGRDEARDAIKNQAKYINDMVDAGRQQAVENMIGHPRGHQRTFRTPP